MDIRRICAAIGLGAWAPTSQAVAQGVPTDLPVIGVPVPNGTGFQPAVTELAEDIHWLDTFIHGIMAVIVVFVVVLLGIVILRYNHRSNPNPARFTHNTRIEIAWTLVPVLILIVIGSFSLPILFKQLEIPQHDVTIKATGNQWYWTYDYTDYDMSFDGLMLAREDLAEHGYGDDLYLLATDTAVVVPVGKVVRLQTTGADVIHSWTVPSFGVKMDAVPGRLNETWFQADEEGVYFGQCSELCGKDHSYMPITVKVVSEEAYEEWLDWALEEYGGSRPGEAEVAEAPSGAASAAEPDAEELADVEAAPDEAVEEEPTGEVVLPEADAPESAAEDATTADEEAAADDANLDAEAGDDATEPAN